MFQGKRKLILGALFMVVNGILAGMIIYTVPAADIAGVLTGLSAKMGAEVVGLGAIIFGNVKEHQVKNGNKIPEEK